MAATVVEGNKMSVCQTGKVRKSQSVTRACQAEGAAVAKAGGGKLFWRTRSTLLSAEILGHSLWSVTKLALEACVLYEEAEDSDTPQARYTVGAQLMFVGERMNKAKNWEGFKRPDSPGIKNPDSSRVVSR